MPRKREISHSESIVWLGVLLDAAFDPTRNILDFAERAKALNNDAQGQGRWSEQSAKSELLAIAADITNYPDDYPLDRQSELLLLWSQRWINDSDWSRLKARVRKRRQRL